MVEPKEDQSKVRYTWTDVSEFIQSCVGWVHRNNLVLSGVYGPPRGGLPLAVMMSHALDIPLLQAPAKRCLVIDDIADSGQTLKKYIESEYTHVAVMCYSKDTCPFKPDFYFKTKSPEQWIEFPWEYSDSHIFWCVGMLKGDGIREVSPDECDKMDSSNPYGSYMSNACVDTIHTADIEIDDQFLIDRKGKDAVNHPSHYTQNGNIESIESIEASMEPMEFQGYLKGNIQKYLWRYRDKNGLEDLKKARWYLNKLIEQYEDPSESIPV